ncbi:hypothetical protein MTO96_035409 [Rhipicephalus appendiculatus]
MEEDGKPSSVRYEHQDDSVSFTDSIRNERTAFKGLREGWMAIHKRSRSLPWKAVLLTSLVTASSTYLVLFYLFGGKPSSCGESVEAFSYQVPPVGITMVSLSAYETLIRWEPPPKVFGFLTGYTVQTCHTFALCDADESVKGCTEHHTFEASLKIQTKADTPYCILVIAIVRCGMDTISSPPAAQEIRTPLVDLPDVQNLHLVSAGNHAMTVTWDRPQAEFDYYRIDVAAANKYTDTSSGMHNVGFLHKMGPLFTPTEI